MTRCVESAKGIRLVCGRGGFDEPIVANSVVQMLFVKAIARALKVLLTMVIKGPGKRVSGDAQSTIQCSVLSQIHQLSDDASSGNVEVMKLAAI